MQTEQNAAPAASAPVYVNPKTPSKPKPTEAPLDVLMRVYNDQCPAYNEAVAKLSEGLSKVPPTLEPMDPVDPATFGHNDPQSAKDDIVDRIKRQNRRLGRTVRRRALELLEMRIKGPDGRPMTDADGRSVGLKYIEVLGIIHEEFPEASTSVACLRWYVVHLRMDANDLGLPWPDLPQIRPRAKTAKEKSQ
jgi:hypothetical protein